MHECNTFGGQKKAPGPLDLEVQAVVNFLAWILDTELPLLTAESSLKPLNKYLKGETRGRVTK